MSFNGSGAYSLPAGNPVVTGTTISSTTHNATMTDIATALSNTICKDGQSTPTANIKMGGYKITGLAAGSIAGDALRYEQVTASTGAALVGADDGSAGSLWTTVQGFINKIISSAGASVVGFIQAGTGAVARWVQDKLRERVSVFDFMTAAQIADVQAGTLTLDVTTAVQAALNSGAKRVIAPEGHYKTTAYLNVPSGVEFIGDGKGKTYIHCMTSSVAAPQSIVKSAGIVFLGTCPADNYTTYSSATGDYFVSSALPFAAASTIKSGATAFTAANAGDVSSLVAGSWLHMSEGLPAWHPAKSEFVQVASVVGTTVNLKSALRNLYANTTAALGAFIRSYALTASPGGGGAGYPNMSTWIDAGFRLVTPVTNCSVRGMSIVCAQTGGVSKIGWFSRLAVNCSVDIEIVDGVFWCIDSQDMNVKITGGMTSAVGASYLANGCNGIECDINILNQLAIEEGGQNVSGTVKAIGYNTIKQFVANARLNYFGYADAVPSLEASTVRNVFIHPTLRSRSAALSVITPALTTIATNIPQAFLTGEVPLYYSCGVTLDAGECISIDNPASSISTTNGGQVRCLDTVVPAIQTSRYKGTQVIDGRRQVQRVTTFPAYYDIEAGERFISDSYGELAVTAKMDSTIAQQFNFPGTLDTLIVNSITTGGTVQVGDILVFRLSDSAAAPVNWSWAVVQVTAVNTASSAVRYTPANPAARTAITAANENNISIYRINNRFLPPAVIVARSGSDAQYGGNIPAIGTTYSGPLQLGTYHFWVDANGRLRVKNGVPTGDLDGLLVASETQTYTVATLPAAATTGQAVVSDATVTTFASIVVGGGANAVPVYSDGTNWRIG